MDAKSRRLLLAAGVVVALPLLLWAQPLFFGRMIPQVDHVTHLRWFSQFNSALADGLIVPRWAFASHGGLGDPTFLYYAPAFYYLASLLAAAGQFPEQALLWAAWLPYLALGAVALGMVPRGIPIHHALIAALLLASCPILFFLSTHYGALPWVMATPFFILFALESIKDRPLPQRLALWFGLICITHVLSGLMALLSTGLARLFFAPPLRQALRGHLAWGCGSVLGMALAAFYLYPALTLQDLVNPAAWTDDPTLDWHRAFAFPLLTYFQYGFRWFSIQWPLPLLALAMSAIVLLLTRPAAAGRPAGGAPDDADPGTMARRLAGIALAALLLGSELAYPLYAHVAPLQKLQWPYRFVVPGMVSATLAFALAVFAPSRRTPPGLPLRIAAGTAVLLHCLFNGYLQYNLLAEGKPLPKLERAMQNDFGQPEYLPATRGERWQEYVAAGKLPGECRRSGLQCTGIRHDTHAFSATIATDAPQSVRLPIFAFPGWQLALDGKRQTPAIDPETGLIRVDLPAGRHEVQLRWQGLPAETIGRWISAAGLLGLLVLLAVYRRSQSAQRQNDETRAL